MCKWEMNNKHVLGHLGSIGMEGLSKWEKIYYILQEIEESQLKLNFANERSPI